MPPGPRGSDVLNRGHRNAVPDGDRLEGIAVGSFGANGANNRLSKPSVSMVFPLRRLLRRNLKPVSSLAHHVVDVVGCRSEKQVERIATRRVIACVTDENPVRYRSVGFLPHSAMSGDTLGATTALVKISIPSNIDRACPRPARIARSTVDTAPKAVSQRLPTIKGRPATSTEHCAILLLRPFCPGGTRLKCGAAPRADYLGVRHAPPQRHTRFTLRSQTIACFVSDAERRDRLRLAALRTGLGIWSWGHGRLRLHRRVPPVVSRSGWCQPRRGISHFHSTTPRAAWYRLAAVQNRADAEAQLARLGG